MRPAYHLIMCLALGTLLLFNTGCVQHHKHWGEDATPLPGWYAVGQAAKNAFTDPQTWGPLIAAGAIVTLDADDKITDWAVDQDLMFNSTLAASDASDDWLELSEALVYATALATPSGETAGEWLINKGKGLGATYLITKSSFTISDNAKKPFSRERPDGSNDESFPSAHALRASMHAAMAARNVDAMGIHDHAKFFAKGGIYTLAGMTAWARMEANKHHPSDVLVGYAIGRLMGVFLNDAFITPDTDTKIRLNAYGSSNSWRLGVEGNFD